MTDIKSHFSPKTYCRKHSALTYIELKVKISMYENKGNTMCASRETNIGDARLAPIQYHYLPYVVLAKKKGGVRYDPNLSLDIRLDD